MKELQIILTQKTRLRLPAALVERLAAQALRQAPKPVVVEVLVVGKALMRRYNRQFRGVGAPTDVLSLSFGAKRDVQSSDAPLHLGMIVLCAPLLRAQAKKHGQTLKAELKLLIKHSVKNLLQK